MRTVLMHTHMQDSSAKPLGLESPAVHTHTQQEGSGIRADPPTAGGVLPAGAVGAAGATAAAAAELLTFDWASKSLLSAAAHSVG